MEKIISLEEREQRIEDAERNNYIIRGSELAAIRDSKSWKQRYNKATFEEYCEERWELGKVQVWNLTNAAAFAEKVHYSELQIPTRETHIRPLLERRQMPGLRAASRCTAAWRNTALSSQKAAVKKEKRQ
jgi:hypothetical protein